MKIMIHHPAPVNGESMIYTRQDMEKLPPNTTLQMSKQGHRTLVKEWRMNSGEITPYVDQFLPAEIIH